MGVGTSLVLIAAGAILKFAVTASVSGVELETIGTILMVIGIVGLVIVLLYPFLTDRRGEVVERERVREPDERPTRRY